MTFLGKNQHLPWSDKELEYLDKNYHLLSNEEISKALFQINQVWRSPIAIKSKANKRNLNKGFFWRQEEIAYLSELIGEYPLSKLTLKYQQWAKDNGHRERSPSQIKNRIKSQRDTQRLNASTKYLTGEDLRYLLGCDRRSISNLLKTYSKELKPKTEGLQSYVLRSVFRNFLLEHQHLLLRYQNKLDICWLADILGKR